MNFSVVYRFNPQRGRDERYFRLKECYRDETGAVRNRLVLTVGFEMNDIPMEDVRLVAQGLTTLWESGGAQTDLFGDRLACYSDSVRGYIERFWQQIVDKGRLDVIAKAKASERRKAERLVDVNTIRYRMKLDNEKRKAADSKGKYPTPFGTEIVRTMSTQKAVTTEAVNALGEKVKMRICSEPT